MLVECGCVLFVACCVLRFFIVGYVGIVVVRCVCDVLFVLHVVCCLWVVVRCLLLRFVCWSLMFVMSGLS